MTFAVSGDAIDMAEGGHDGMRMMSRDSKVMRPVAQSDAVTLLLVLPSLMSSNPPHAARPRPPARKKPNDDAAYTGPSAAALGVAGGGPQATKRQATDRAEGEPRNKRKKVETIVNTQNRSVIDQMSEPRTSLVSQRQEFVTYWAPIMKHRLNLINYPWPNCTAISRNSILYQWSGLRRSSWMIHRPQQH